MASLVLLARFVSPVLPSGGVDELDLRRFWLILGDFLHDLFGVCRFGVFLSAEKQEVSWVSSTQDRYESKTSFDLGSGLN